MVWTKNNFALSQRSGDPLNHEFELMVSRKNSTSPISRYNLIIFTWNTEACNCFNDFPMYHFLIVLSKFNSLKILSVDGNNLRSHPFYFFGFLLKAFQISAITNIFEVLFEAFIVKSFIWLQRLAKNSCDKQFRMVQVNDLLLNHSISQGSSANLFISKIYLYFVTNARLWLIIVIVFRVPYLFVTTMNVIFHLGIVIQKNYVIHFLSKVQEIFDCFPTDDRSFHEKTTIFLLKAAIMINLGKIIRLV